MRSPRSGLMHGMSMLNRQNRGICMKRIMIIVILLVLTFYNSYSQVLLKNNVDCYRQITTKTFEIYTRLLADKKTFITYENEIVNDKYLLVSVFREGLVITGVFILATDKQEIEVSLSSQFASSNSGLKPPSRVLNVPWTQTWMPKPDEYFIVPEMKDLLENEILLDEHINNGIKFEFITEGFDNAIVNVDRSIVNDKMNKIISKQGVQQ